MQRNRLVGLAVLGGLLWSSPAGAEDRRGVGALVGTRTEVYVTNVEGLERKGHVRAAGEEGIHLVFAGRETLVPWSDVAIVERRGDAVWDGALKGAAISAAIYSLMVLTADDHGSEGQRAFVAGGAIAWGLIGTVIDALHVGRSRVFVSPDVTRETGRHSIAPTRPSAAIVVGARVTF